MNNNPTIFTILPKEGEKSVCIFGPVEPDSKIIITSTGDGGYSASFNSHEFRDYYYKQKIVRNAYIPSWVSKALNSGMAVFITSIDYNIDKRYVIVRGHASRVDYIEKYQLSRYGLDDILKITTPYSEGVRCGDPKVEKTGIVPKNFEEFKKAMEQYPEYLKEKDYNWVISNPTEKRKLLERRVIGETDDIVTIRCIYETDTEVTKHKSIDEERDVIYYDDISYNKDTNTLSWKTSKKKFFDDFTYTVITSEKKETIDIKGTNKRLFSEEVVHRTVDDGKYESDDGMRMCHSYHQEEWIIRRYECTLDTGEKFLYVKEEFVKAYD